MYPGFYVVLDSPVTCFFVPKVLLWKWGGGDLDPGIKNIPSFVSTEEHF